MEDNMESRLVSEMDKMATIPAVSQYSMPKARAIKDVITPTKTILIVVLSILKRKPHFLVMLLNCS
jgi:hypothetical protein